MTFQSACKCHWGYQKLYLLDFQSVAPLLPDVAPRQELTWKGKKIYRKQRSKWHFNSLATERCGSNLNSVISEHMLQIKFMSTYPEIALR